MTAPFALPFGGPTFIAGVSDALRGLGLIRDTAHGEAIPGDLTRTRARLESGDPEEQRSALDRLYRVIERGAEDLENVRFRSDGSAYVAGCIRGFGTACNTDLPRALHAAGSIGIAAELGLPLTRPGDLESLIQGLPHPIPPDLPEGGDPSQPIPGGSAALGAQPPLAPSGPGAVVPPHPFSGLAFLAIAALLLWGS